ncbi:MAG: hypothetical protein PHW47_04970 [Lachnospira sp.]|nr:hypothetical protein [Lachnospira sp.]
MKKKKDWSMILYFVASVCFYAAAVMGFIRKDNTAMAVTWACMGSAMLCFGAARLNNKNKNNDGEQ